MLTWHACRAFRPGNFGCKPAPDRHRFATDECDGEGMLDIEMTHTEGFALVRVKGRVATDEEAETLAAGLAFVPVDDDLVIDLADLDLLTTRAAGVLGSALQQRALWSEVVVVSSRDYVTMRLILSEIDRAVPIVRELKQAADVICARRGVMAVAF